MQTLTLILLKIRAWWYERLFDPRLTADQTRWVCHKLATVQARQRRIENAIETARIQRRRRRKMAA